MIAVIADDFTGAAEISGVGLRYGLDIVIQTQVEDGGTIPDLLITATNTRSMSANDASEKIRKITGQLLKLNPEFIFKKLDSVLRGNVADELFSQMEVMGKNRAIVVAGNPKLGRMVSKGIYSIKGELLHQTSFSHDPEFPRNSSSVLELVKTEAGEIYSCSEQDQLPDSGIIIGDVTGLNSIPMWTDPLDDHTILGGSAGFFDEIIARRFRKAKNPMGEIYRINEESLFILGSLFPKSEKMISKIDGIGMIKMNMPDQIYMNPEIDESEIEKWAGDIISKINDGYRVVVTIENRGNNHPDLPRKIREITGRLIKMILVKVEIMDLLIEGGATSFEVFRNLNIHKLYPFQELDLGIIQMKVDEYPGMVITTKPGSYSWPDSVEFENIKYITSR